MPRITFIEPDGTERTVTIRAGLSVMEGAVQNDIAGIVAECGGACSCATCCVDVDPAWQAATGSPSLMESDMLSILSDLRPSYRLSCQIQVTDALDGLVVHVPESQG